MARVMMDPMWPKQLESEIEPMLSRLCGDIADDASRIVHVDDERRDTIHLRDHIESEVHGTHGRVGSNLVYALAEEYRQGGERHAGSHAYLRPALFKARALR